MLLSIFGNVTLLIAGKACNKLSHFHSQHKNHDTFLFTEALKVNKQIKTYKMTSHALRGVVVTSNIRVDMEVMSDTTPQRQGS